MSFNMKQYGVSLIEILITTLILGIGLLGVAALQVSSVSGTQEGFFTSQATFIAEDITSRMRSGRLMTAVPFDSADDTAILIHSGYVGSYHGNEAIGCDTSGANAKPKPKMCRSDNGSTPSPCTQAEMAEFDKWEVCEIAKKTLPDGKVRMLQNSSLITVVIDWAATRGRQDFGAKDNFNTNCSAFNISDDRNCIIMEIIP